MPTLHETIDTNLDPEAAFAFVADFANAPAWDPGTATAERIDDGPVGVGARYRLGVRMRDRVVPMEYRIVVHEAPRRVVLEGVGSGVRARDDITFAPGGAAGGTRVDYVAEIHLTDWKRFLEPLLGGAFAKIGRDAREGMQRALDELALAERTRRVATGAG
jgi:carbon monoxide dehydrogenase subunit G